MATKSKEEQVKKEATPKEETPKVEAERNSVVRKEPKKSFDERTTGANQPWLNEDGSQNNGSEEEK